ncbi:MAG: bifunctional phosphoribosyl-AMP cyclohydrolase/phosphoribosyl-ATP diphosphatase HisIE [Thermaerobacter sp.]|nr:bifunctional phosphoribosyl-AMP cyclohydrolase/phosphoribosyl-ATP diphosphatase HisIE [Thermaerobacter sp.]
MLTGEVRFGPDGLVPAVVQEAGTGRVLMLAYMNRPALEETLRTGRACYFSRSRGELWRKGETSGHTQEVRSVAYDCDGDTLLLRVEQAGPACHTGEPSCFYRYLREDPAATADLGEVLAELWGTLRERRAHPREGSYTAHLLAHAPDLALQKVGEEAAEVILAGKNADPEQLAWELADLWYHSLVVLLQQGMSPEDLARELARRRSKRGAAERG